MKLTWNAVARDIAAVSAAVSILVTDNVLSGTAQHYTVSILAAVNALILALIRPANSDNAPNNSAPIVPTSNK